MRFNEFRIVEAAQPGYYTVGDSHAVGMANYAGRPWISKGKNGTSATNSMHPRAIDTIPQGSVVAISVGANDTFARNPNPGRIASSVKMLVDYAKAKGLKVSYVLFPVGTRDNKEARAQTRDAIKSALAGVNIVDLEGSTLVDGVHADSAAYKKAAASILSGSRVDADPAADAQADDAARQPAEATELRAGPPYPNKDKAAVRALQNRLEELGYSVGSTGADGKYGPRTTRAVRAFKKDNNIPGDGLSMSADDLKKLAAAKKVDNPTSTGNTRSSYQDIPSGAGNTRHARTALSFFIEKGLTPAQAAGIVGNLQAESGPNLNPSAIGDGGQAVGIAQWHPDRRRYFDRALGKPFGESTFEDQLEFIWWELNNTEQRALRKLRDTSSPEQAAAVFDRYYERSSGAHRERRMQYASAIARDNSNRSVA